MKRLNLATRVLIIVVLVIASVVMINYLRPDTKLIPIELKGPNWGYGHLGDAYK